MQANSTILTDGTVKFCAHKPHRMRGGVPQAAMCLLYCAGCLGSGGSSSKRAPPPSRECARGPSVPGPGQWWWGGGNHRKWTKPCLAPGRGESHVTPPLVHLPFTPRRLEGPGAEVRTGSFPRLPQALAPQGRLRQRGCPAWVLDTMGPSALANLTPRYTHACCTFVKYFRKQS